MAWFSRNKDESPARVEALPETRGPQPQTDEQTPDLPLRPVIRRVGVEEQQRIARGRTAFEEAGIDVGDLAALGRAFDAAMTGWLDTPVRKREGHDAIVERFAIGVGEHLDRHTDLSWALVTDAFGTDLAVAGGRDEFVVVPSNLVASRWLNEESGWVPGVVGHLVRLRASR